MAELGIIASVVQIADVGLRLSVKLYTFGEIVARADRSVISISKDVSLTSGVLKELGQILDKDKETRTFSEDAVHTADGVVKECLEVFREMENILVKKIPSLVTGGGRDGKGGERTKRAMVLLERLKWGYLQPKLELLRSNLDRLKSTLLLMLNVITYARQVSGKIESPSVIAEQRSLIEDLAHSNQEYIRKFERLKLGIDGTAVEQVDDAANIGGGAIEREPGLTTRSLLEASTRESMGMKFIVESTSLQDKENTRGLGSRELTTATRWLPKAQRNETRSLANPPNANTGNVFMNTSVRTNIVIPPVQERGIPATEAPMELEQEVLFKQLEHYSMLISNLLKEVDEAQYKITFKSRLQVKGGLAGLHEKEIQELERIWGGTALQSAEQRLGSLVEGLGGLPRMNRFAVKDPVPMSSPVIMRRGRQLPSMAPNREPDVRATPDEPLFSLDAATGASLMEDLPQMPNLVNEAAAKESRIIPTEGMVEAYTRNDSVPGPGPVPQARVYRANSKERTEELVSRVTNFEAEAKHRKSIALSFEQRHGDSKVGDTESRQRGEGTGERGAAVVNNFSAHGGNTALLLKDARTQHRAPAAPTTSHAPFSFGGQSPQGVPQFYGPTKNELRQEKLVLPATKKREGNNFASPSTPAQAPIAAAPNKLLPFGKTESLEPTALPVTGSSLGPSANEQIRTAMRQGTNSARHDKLVLQQQDTVKPGSNGLEGGVDENYSMPFNSDLNNSDILESFDFEKFSQTTSGDFDFDPSTFEKADVTEIAKSYSPFAGLEGCVVAKCGTVEDKDGNTVGPLTDGNASNADRLLGHAVDEDELINDEHGSIIGHAKLYEEAEYQEQDCEGFEYEEAEEEEEEEEVNVNLSILEGLTVNERGNVVGPKGFPIARLVEGNAKELAGKKCDEKGQLWNDFGKVIGCCELIPENEREARPEDPFAGLEGCVVGKDAFVENEGRERVGVVVVGDAKRLIGCAVDEEADIIDKYGNVKGHAEPYEEPEEETADLSFLEEKTVSKPGSVVYEHGIVEGDLEEVIGRKVNSRGQISTQISNDNGVLIGRAENLTSLTEHPPQNVSTDSRFKAFGGFRSRRTTSKCAEKKHGQMLSLDDMYDPYASETGKAISWQRESEQGDSRLTDMEVVDRLVALWTTVKAL